MKDPKSDAVPWGYTWRSSTPFILITLSMATVTGKLKFQILDRFGMSVRSFFMKRENDGGVVGSDVLMANVVPLSRYVPLYLYRPYLASYA
jgi:hypothetical protein